MGFQVASPSKMRERTVAFFEIVALRKGEQERVPQMDWEKALETIALAPIEKRKVEKDSVFVGAVATVNEKDNFLLHRIKDDGEWLSVIDLDTGEWSEIEKSASQGYLDTSVISFLPYGNIIGMMQGATAAPSHKSLEVWLNAVKIFPNEQLVVRPLLSQAEINRLQGASGASRVEIRIGSSKAEALREKTGRLARFLRMAGREYGDINVTMIISIPKGKTRREDRERLLGDLVDLADVMPEAAERAKASLVYTEIDGPDSTRLVELVEHHITAKRRVPAVDDEGRSIRILSAVGAIIGVAAEHEDELRAAADAIDA